MSDSDHLHLINTFKKISKNQYYSLFFSLIAATLAWFKLIFIIGPTKNDKPSIGKYQIYGLLMGYLIAIIYWLRLILAVDPLNNNK